MREKCPQCGNALPEDGTPCLCQAAEKLQSNPESTDAAGEEKKTPFLLRKLPFAILLTAVVCLVAGLVMFFSVLTPDDAGRVSLFQQDMLPVAVEVEGEDGTPVILWGYLGQDGKFVIEPCFEEAKEFSDVGLAPVKKDGAWGYINKKGDVVIEPQFEDAAPFSEKRLAAVKYNDSYGYINKKGDFVINPQFDSAYPFAQNGLALVSIGNNTGDPKYGYINTDGVYVITPQYDMAGSFDEHGLAAVYAFGNWGMIDKNGEWVINPQFDGIESFADNDLALVYKDGKFGFINRDGVYVVEPTYEDAGGFVGNLALVKKDGKYGYINKKGEVVIDFLFDGARSFAENGLAAVMPSAADGLWGFIDKDGELVIDAKFETVGNFSAGLAYAVEDGECFFLDKNGDTAIALGENCVGADDFYADGYTLVYYLEDGKAVCRVIDKKGTLESESFSFARPSSVSMMPPIER